MEFKGFFMEEFRCEASYGNSSLRRCDPDAEGCDPDAVELADISKLCCCDASATSEIQCSIYMSSEMHVMLNSVMYSISCESGPTASFFAPWAGRYTSYGRAYGMFLRVHGRSIHRTGVG